METILYERETWTIPFVVLLVGGYVVEIIEVVAAALPNLDRAPYANIVRENPPVMRVLRARAISYWNRYYRFHYQDQKSYSDRKSYLGLVKVGEPG